MKRMLPLLLAVSMLLPLQGQINVFPHVWSFSTGFNGWSMYDRDGESGDNWVVSGDHLYTRCSYNDPQTGAYVSHTPDEWLVSPLVQLGNGEFLFEFTAATINAHLQIYVSYDNDPNNIVYDSPLQDVVLNSNNRIKYSYSLADYAGEEVYIAIRYQADYGSFSFVELYDARVREFGVPMPKLPADTIVTTGETIVFHCSMLEGNDPSMTYSWSSTMQAAGDATITQSTEVLHISYTYPGTDTIVVTAQNNTGLARDTMTVRAYDFAPATLPYTTSFDDILDNDHWITFNGENGWYAGTGASEEGDMALYISDDDGVSNGYDKETQSISYAVRAIEITDDGNYTYSYRWRCHGQTNFGTPIDYVRLYLAKDLKNLHADQNVALGAWQPLSLGYLYGQSEWQEEVGELQGLTAGTYFIVMRWINYGTDQFGEAGDPAAAIDDLQFTTLTCHRPTNLAVTATTDSSITIAWSAGGGETEWAYSLNGGEYTEALHSPYEITGLEAGTQYGINLRSVCADGSHSLDVHTVGVTDCRPVSELPWTEDFSTFGILVTDPCWERGTNSIINGYPNIKTLDGNKAVDMYGSLSTEGSEWTYLTLPRFEVPVDSLELTFDMRRVQGGYDAKITVGVIAEGTPFCMTCFDSVASFRAVNTTWTTFSVDFSAYTGQGNRIVLVTDTNLTGPYFNEVYIDNLHVYHYSACRPVAGLGVESLNAHGVNIEWDDVEGATYSVAYRAAGTEEAWIEGDADMSPFGISGLEEGVLYEVEVRTICGTGDTSRAALLSFRTPCVVDELPYAEDFETASRDCWTVVGTTQYASVRWNLTTAAEGSAKVHSGTHSMYSSAAENYYGAFDEWLISPAYELPTNLDPGATFSWYSFNRERNYSADGYTVLATIGDALDTASYSDTLAEVGTDAEWTLHVVNIGAYAGETLHIAFRHNATATYNGIYIDDMELNVSQRPVVSLSGQAEVAVGSEDTISVSLIGGAAQGVEYSWRSAREERGEAYVTPTSDPTRLIITYLSEGYDTVCVVAENAHGADSACFTVHAYRPITCPAPTGLEMTSADGTTMHLVWNAGGAETEWEVTIGGQQPVVVSDNHYTATGLTPLTQYAVSVRAVCGADDSSTAVTGLYNSGCAAVSELPWCEDFDAYEPGPAPANVDCWSQQGGGRLTVSATQPLSGNSGDRNLRLVRTSQRDTTPMLVVMPDFAMPLRSLELTLHTRVDGATAGRLEVGYTSAEADLTNFVPLLTLDAADSAQWYAGGQYGWRKDSLTLETVPVGSRLALRQLCAGTINKVWFVDSVCLSTPDSVDPYACAEPTGLTASRIASGYYRVAWTPGSYETRWELKTVRLSPDYDSAVSVSANAAISIGGITDGATYRLRVRALCTDELQSEWSTPYTFTATAPEPGEEPGDSVAIGRVTRMAQSLQLQPNPAADMLSVTWTAGEGAAQGVIITMVDICGRPCGRWAPSGNTLTIDVRSLPAGTYFLRLATPSGTSTAKVLVR